MILKALNTILKAESINDVYPVIIPQGIELPASTMQLIGDEPNPAKGETSQFNELSVQISTFANNYSDSISRDQQIKTILDGYRGKPDNMDILIIYDGATDLYENETGVYHRATTYKILKS